MEKHARKCSGQNNVMKKRRTRIRRGKRNKNKQQVEKRGEREKRCRWHIFDHHLIYFLRLAEALLVPVL
jgi:hypothetical protein